MTVKAEKLPNEPIVVMHFLEPFDGEKDLAEANQLTEAYMAETKGFIYRIENILELDFNFTKATTGLAAATRGTRGAMSDPNVYGMMVGKDEMSEFTAKSFSQEQYGGKQTPYFTSLKAAIQHAREQIKKSN